MRVAIREAEIAAQAKAIAAWRAGGSPGFARTSAPLLRVRGDNIETSYGADVPLSVAPMVWRAVNAVRDAGTAQDFPRAAAPRLGSFTLDRIEPDGDIVAGCHCIPFAELQYVAGVLGYADARAQA